MQSNPDTTTIRAQTAEGDETMAPTLRIALNPENRKDLIAAREDGNRVLQVWKRGALLDTLNEEELLDLQEHQLIADYVTAHLNGKNITSFLGKTSYIRLLNHLLQFIHLRGKPFIQLTRDSAFEELNGVPQFKDIYLGLTAWTALCEHGKTIDEFLATPTPLNKKVWC